HCSHASSTTMSHAPSLHDALPIFGDERTLLLDTGHPSHWDAVEPALDALLGDRPLDLVLPTHPEMPHAGNLPKLARKYTGLTVRSEEHTSELQSRFDLVCRLLLAK